ncbi:MAG: outer membrane protein assembly factor BamD [Bacteroidales bacterium]
MVRKKLFTVFNLSLLALVVIIVFSSCSNFKKVLKSPDNELKYKTALELYEKGDYSRALQLFDILLPVYRGTSKAETIYFDYAYCYYNQKDYLLASYFFKRYTQLYPNNKNTEEAAFKAAYCYYLDSPKYSLDQENTNEALKELQKFVNTYPTSEKVAECNKLMDELRAKLEKKAFEIAILFYHMESYAAAVKSFENLLADFPEVENKEDILFYIFKSYYEYAYKSVEEKKKERFESSLEAYNNLIYLFPDSKYVKEASVKSENVKKELNIK